MAYLAHMMTMSMLWTENLTELGQVRGMAGQAILVAEGETFETEVKLVKNLAWVHSIDIVILVQMRVVLDDRDLDRVGLKLEDDCMILTACRNYAVRDTDIRACNVIKANYSFFFSPIHQNCGTSQKNHSFQICICFMHPTKGFRFQR